MDKLSRHPEVRLAIFTGYHGVPKKSPAWYPVSRARRRPAWSPAGHPCQCSASTPTARLLLWYPVVCLSSTLPWPTARLSIPTYIADLQSDTSECPPERFCLHCSGLVGLLHVLQSCFGLQAVHLRFSALPLPCLPDVHLRSPALPLPFPHYVHLRWNCLSPTCLPILESVDLSLSVSLSVSPPLLLSQ